MAYKSRKVATCPCGDGDQHSLRTSGLCQAMRTGEVSPAEGQKRLAEIRAGNRDDKRRKGEDTNVHTPVAQPAVEV